MLGSAHWFLFVAALSLISSLATAQTIDEAQEGPPGNVNPGLSSANLDPRAEALRFFETVIAGNESAEILRRLRPIPAGQVDRTQALRSLPAESVLVPNEKERTKLDALQAILVYHDRQQVIDIKLIDVPMAVLGLFDRAVLLISRPALRLLSNPELQAAVAHEMGHDYFWREDAALRARHDTRSLQAMELKCDGVAVLTLLALGLDSGHLYRAIEKVARFNGVPKARWGNNGYPPPRDRERFILALLDLIHHGALDRDMSPMWVTSTRSDSTLPPWRTTRAPLYAPPLVS